MKRKDFTLCREWGKEKEEVRELFGVQYDGLFCG